MYKSKQVLTTIKVSAIVLSLPLVGKITNNERLLVHFDKQKEQSCALFGGFTMASHTAESSEQEYTYVG